MTTFLETLASWLVHLVLRAFVWLCGGDMQAAQAMIDLVEEL